MSRRPRGAPKRPHGRPRSPGTSPQGPRRAALQGLVAVETGRSQRLRDAMDTRGLDDRDRDLAFELAQGTERLHLMLDFVLSRFVTRRLPKVALVRSVLRLGAYQLLMLSRVPAHAAVHETVALLPDRRGFPNAVLRQLAAHIHHRAADPAAPRREWALPPGPEGPRCLSFDGDAAPGDAAALLAVRHGLPEFLVQRWIHSHGLAAATSACAASSSAPSVFLRATARVPQGTDPVASLADQQVSLQPLEPDRWRGGPGARAVYRVLGGSPFGTGAFAEGWFVAQDPTAYAAALALDARPGDRVLDLCAAPGTKTTVLAEAVGETGRVFAGDAKEWKLKFVRDNAARLGLADRIEYLADPTPTATAAGGPAEGTAAAVQGAPFDRALVDVPCSNTGVLARRVEVRRRLSEAAIHELVPVQLACLERALAACRPGATLVYSTCSIEPEENRGVVDRVLGRSCRLVDEHLALPDPLGGDGGYFAVLERTG